MRKRPVVTVIVLVAAASAAAPSLRAELGFGSGPSTVVYPRQQLPLSFSHARHLARDGVSCATCHPAATTSARAADLLIPPEASCAAAGCHVIDRAAPSAECKLCHPGWNGEGQPPRLVFPEPHLRFSHALHAQKRIDCKRCHGDLAAQNVGLATRAQLPRMATCLGCHDGKQATARCAACHPADASGTLITSFPEGELVPSGTLRADAHDASFRSQHRTAGQDGDYCAACHKQQFCSDCHDAKQKPLDFHAGDYTRAHAVDARRNAPDCQSCHRLQTFCVGCHQRTGVTGDPRTGEFDDDRKAPPAAAEFHPPGWSVQGARDFHGPEAKRAIFTCVSCHREEMCMTCHTAQPGARMNASPHGPAWRGSSRCETIEEKNPRLCLRCHLEGRGCDE